MEKLSKEDLIKKASKSAEDAMKLHPFYKGKIEIVSKVCIRDFSDFAIWYTPGVAEPCKAIHKNKEAVFTIQTRELRTQLFLMEQGYWGLEISGQRPQCLSWRERHFFSNT